ncbi:hypothetical protein GALMADRAFT_271189 [Galerina marginata CBS 339.88]|uniref:Uncharacterized protein n=1 Tax=Galerina marginata (strain CBS 339.88) TaxID=685588 RepID=A0A067SK47_GALM3|nr:hypothetical protein GALMADRAFT_271189 [Galerina marginata CBS 339.88]
MRMNNDDDFLHSLSLALAEKFYKTFTTTPNPQRMWVAALQFCLLPRNIEDLDALDSLDVPLEQLLEKPIDGRLMIYELADVSNLDNFPLEQRRHRLWRTHRDEMNRTGLSDEHLVHVRFRLRDMDLYFLPIPVRKRDLLEVGNNGLQNTRRVTALENRGVMKINQAIALESAISTKFRCPLGEDDKKIKREWAIKAAKCNQ